MTAVLKCSMEPTVMEEQKPTGRSASASDCLRAASRSNLRSSCCALWSALSSSWGVVGWEGGWVGRGWVGGRGEWVEGVGRVGWVGWVGGVGVGGAGQGAGGRGQGKGKGRGVGWWMRCEGEANRQLGNADTQEERRHQPLQPLASPPPPSSPLSSLFPLTPPPSLTSRHSGTTPNSTAVFPRTLSRQRSTGCSAVDRSLTSILGPMPCGVVCVVGGLRGG
jgi:hypothetical protein